jgi:hypothetical protein
VPNQPSADHLPFGLTFTKEEPLRLRLVITVRTRGRTPAGRVVRSTATTSFVMRNRQDWLYL